MSRIGPAAAVASVAYLTLPFLLHTTCEQRWVITYQSAGVKQDEWCIVHGAGRVSGREVGAAALVVR